MQEPLIELRKVMAARKLERAGLFGLWGGAKIRVLDGISLRLGRGESLGIMGGSGAGKSTLAEMLTLRRPADRGQVLFQGADAAKLRGDDLRRAQRRLQLVRQDPRDSLELERPARQQLRDELRRQGLPDPDERIARALDQVELRAGLVDRAPAQMSGGEQQRLAIARVLAMNPLLVALDEPVSGVDEPLRRHMLGLLEQVRERGGAALAVISQDARVIRRLTERAVILFAGRVVEDGPTERLLENARHPHSQLLLGLEAGRLPAEEDVTGPARAGCPWAPHCRSVAKVCHEVDPPLRDVAPGHLAACHAV